MKYSILFLASLPVVLAAQGNPKRFEFRGERLGDTLAIPLHEGCDYEKTPGVVRCLEPEVTLGGEQVGISSQYLRGIRYQLILLYKPESFDRLLELFTAQYGRPISQQRTPYRTVGGMADLNHVALWRFRDGIFTLAKYGGSIDGGFGHIENERLGRMVTQREGEQTKAAAARDLGPPQSKFGRKRPAP